MIYETLSANRGARDTQLESNDHEELAHQVHLTPIEWQLLQALLRHPGRLVSQRHLLQEVWARPMWNRPTICVNMSRRSGTSSKMIQRGHAISSPNPEWAIASSPDTR